MENTLQIIKAYKLEKYLKDIIENNTGNHNPYHNLYHLLTVMKNAYFIAKSENINNNKTRLILIACLFHDFNHSGGKIKDDNKNIEEAIKAFRKYSEESEEGNLFIENLIKITRFPYDKDEKLDIFDKIIRDADLLQSCETNFIQQILLGLPKEMSGSEVITTDFLENQMKFLNSVEIFTKYAKDKLNGTGSKMEDCEYLIEILKK